MVKLFNDGSTVCRFHVIQIYFKNAPCWLALCVFSFIVTRKGMFIFSVTVFPVLSHTCIFLRTNYYKKQIDYFPIVIGFKVKRVLDKWLALSGAEQYFSRVFTTSFSLGYQQRGPYHSSTIQIIVYYFCFFKYQFSVVAYLVTILQIMSPV